MPLSRNNVQPVDPVLTAFMNDYSNEMFVMDKVFPVVSVGVESGTYYTMTGKEKWLETHTRRAPGAKFARMNIDPATGTYTTHEEGQEIAVDKRIQKTALDPFDPYRVAAQTVNDVIKLRRERIVAAILSNAAIFTNTNALAGITMWDDANSDPIAEVNTRKLTIRNGCGRAPNTIVMPWEVYLALTDHPVMINRLSLNNTQILSESIMADLFDIERVFITKAVYNSAQEGQAVVGTPVMGTNVWIGYVNPTPSLVDPSAGYLIQSEGFRAESYYEVQSDSDVVRARINETAEVVSIDTAHLITNVVT